MTGIAIRPRLPNDCDERGDETAERPDAIDDDPGGADKEHDANDVGGLDEAAWNGDGGGEGTDGRGIDGMVRAGDDDAAACRRIVAALVLARRKHPRQHGARGDARDKKDHGVRQLHVRRL